MFSEELLKKAESGNAEAALEVANCYYRGIDVEENNDKAFAWFNRILEMDPNNAVFCLCSKPLIIYCPQAKQFLFSGTAQFLRLYLS